jgi:hypothetical protein
MGLSSRVAVEFGAKLTGTAALGAKEANLAQEYAVTLADGVLAGQADRIWTARVTALAASGTQDFDLAGALADPFGSTTGAVFARVKALIVSAFAANTNNVVVGNAAATQWVGPFGAATHTLAVRPGGALCLFTGSADLTGYPVTAGSADLLRITNGGAGTTVGFDIAVIGCSA